MAQNFEREPQAISEPRHVGDKPDETPGLRGERIVGEFLQSAFSDIFTKIERTEWFDANDKQGIDYIVELAGKDGATGRLAMDVTFTGDAKLNFKLKRTLEDPCAQLKDENKKRYGELIPRIVFKDISTAFWSNHEDEAKKRGVKLIDVIPENEKKKKMQEFLAKALDQIDGLSLHNREYRQIVEPARIILEVKADELGVDYPGKKVTKKLRKTKPR